ncbi:MAG: ribosomal protein [Patescibacteria group bacterium]|jgi:small subunit ribosomal protein S2|nr:ribosomal protein [Patescibacteria group bacterium]
MAETVIVPETAKETVSTVISQGQSAHEIAYFADFDFSTLDVSLEGLLKSGVHFGHLKSRRHPKMDEYIFTTRKNINILDLEQTVTKLNAASAFLTEVVKSGKPVLFVGIKKQTHDTVRSLAERIGMPYVIDRWLGGTLTNFSHIKGRAKYLYETEEKMARGEFKKYTKFEQAKKSEEVERLEKRMGGIKRMEMIPGAIVIADTREADIVLHEARKMQVPIVGIVDSNADPSFVDYPIPGNDDAVSSLRVLLGAIGKGILQAKGGK